ncbi:cyclic nucleotide-binding-like protein [Gilbertella persicaria]|uniref:cyclic nucleotide-binding-like protein n=1 Tax=Gilbertella persicaria TaxID=101096 RepID=UPI00221F8B5A|nr:cyclic nucleotide-binding-like protein [Gilbertella persicaria]KAI8077983.1 cyclic nucleotide-binding-like protein [Gilbertella persicaria]
MSKESVHPFSTQNKEYQVLINELNKQERSQTRHTQPMQEHPNDSFMRETTPIITMTGPDNEEEEEEQDSFPGGLPHFEPKFPKDRRVSVSAESMQPSSSYKKKSLPKKPDAEIDLISHSLQSHFLFQTVEQEQRQEVIDSMQEMRFKSGDWVIEQGAVGDYFYIVSSGTLDCFVNGNKVTQYQRGGSFGELALMYNAPRAASIQATSDAVLWALDRVSFRSILMENNAQKRNMHEKFMQDVPLFKSLELAEMHKIADALEPVWFRDGDVVLRQGDPGDNFYLIERGEAICYRQQPGGQPEQVNQLKKGDYFGGN